jgi:hypothetical protein
VCVCAPACEREREVIMENFSIAVYCLALISCVKYYFIVNGSGSALYHSVIELFNSVLPKYSEN